MKTGIVLEGGAMRGIYTAGVLDVFLEEGVTADLVMGVSAGAVHGCSFVSGQHGRSIRYYMKYCGDPRFMSFRSLLTTGDVVEEQFCYREIPERLDPFDNDAFEASPVKFYAVCSDLETGEAAYLLCPTLRGEAVDRIRASASMPFLSRVVPVEGRLLLDGGVCDSIPATAALRLGCEKLLVVLTRPEGYWKKPSGSLAARVRYRQYNDSLENLRSLEAEGKALVIRPSRDLGIKRMEKDLRKVRAQYDLGREDALAKLAAIREFFTGAK